MPEQAPRGPLQGRWRGPRGSARRRSTPRSSPWLPARASARGGRRSGGTAVVRASHDGSATWVLIASALRGSPAAPPARSRRADPASGIRVRGGAGRAPAARAARSRCTAARAAPPWTDVRPAVRRQRPRGDAGAASSTRRARLMPFLVAGRTQATWVAAARAIAVGVACERAAVDHGQSVRFARVEEQSSELLVRADRSELGCGREHAHSGRPGRIYPALERSVERRSERRARRASAVSRRRRARRVRRWGRPCRRPSTGPSSCSAAASATR